MSLKSPACSPPFRVTLLMGFILGQVKGDSFVKDKTVEKENKTVEKEDKIVEKEDIIVEKENK